jgi:23S rRNA (guanosine2251-2'-O)-methyltransferase
MASFESGRKTNAPMSKKSSTGTSLIAGRNPVREALAQRSEAIEKVMLQKGVGGRPIDDIRRMAAGAGVPVQYVPSARLAQLAAGVNHQGVIALSSPIAYVDADDLLARIASSLDEVRRLKPILVLLDQLADPHNFGAILRSAVAAGAAGVLVPRHHMAPLSAATLKASAGTASRIPIARVVNLVQLINQLKERGYWVVGADGRGDTSVWEMDWDRPIALVIGSEGKGLRARVAEACDYVVSIPMNGPAESLNASVAAGILLFAAARHRA